MADADPKFEAVATGTEPSPVRRRVRRTLIGIAIAIPTLIFLAWAILYITKGRFLKPYFERFASRQIVREVKVADDFQLYLNPINIKFLAEGLTISNPEWAREKNLFEARRIDTSIATFPLIFGTRRMNWLDLTDGDLNLEWDKAHRRNTWTLGDPARPPEPLELPEIRRGSIVGTDVAYTDPLMQLATAIKVETVRARDTRFENDIRFSGNGTMRQRPFTVSGSLMSPNETASGGKNQMAFRAQSAGTILTVSGTLPAATVIEGAELKVGARGPNLSLLFDFLGAAVPDTRAYRLNSNLTKTDGAWRFTRLTGMVGASDLAGRLTITMPDNRLKLDADLATRTLDIVDIGPIIGYDPKAVAAGRLVERVGGTPRVLPDAPLRADAISRFDAHLNYKVRSVRAESFPVSNLALTLDLNRSLMKLSPFSFDVARGHLDSDIEINARGTPVRTRYDIRLAPTPTARLLAGFGVEEAGTSGVVKARAQLTGEGDSIRKSLASSDGRIAIILPQGTLWTRNVQLSELDLGTFVWKLWQQKLKDPVQINCGLIAFTVRDGIAAADPILIDTRKNVILGRGGFSFKNEAVDVRVRADGKKFSLLSAQSPVGVQGYFAAPRIDVISPQLIGRGAAGLGLAAVASPLAGIIAFVDVGDAKAAQCGPVLAGATAAAQRTKGGKPRDDVGRGTTAKSESGQRSPEAAKKQRKKFLGIF